mgnify:CR=1 FL=1
MSTLSVTDPDFLLKFGNTVKDSLVSLLEECQQEVPDRVVLAFNRPPQDCCPELAVWVDNMRPWDGVPFEGLQFGHLQCFNLWAVDVGVRIGRCYVDIDGSGNPIDPQSIEDLARPIYRDGNILYVGWVAKFRAKEICQICPCDIGTVSNLISYNEGGCAGWEFIVTVGFAQ